VLLTGAGAGAMLYVEDNAIVGVLSLEPIRRSVSRLRSLQRFSLQNIRLLRRSLGFFDMMSLLHSRKASVEDDCDKEAQLSSAPFLERRSSLKLHLNTAVSGECGRQFSCA
jgi:hypothetical protein